LKYVKEPSPEKVLNAFDVKKSGDFNFLKMANEQRRGLFSSNEKIPGKIQMTSPRRVTKTFGSQKPSIDNAPKFK
jgi:hypothetical protein